MKVVVQRTKDAKVTVNGEVTGAIDRGLVLLVGLTHSDEEEDLQYAVDKVVNLRIFEDHDGKMNHSLLDIEGSILSISQFTLYGDTRKGRRPNFMSAAKPEQAEELYVRFNQILREKGVRVETGRFGEMMDVSMTNEGPVTLIVETNEGKPL